QTLAMLPPCLAVDVCLVLETHEVEQHHNSSPSMSSSATSTTTLWISMRNQSRNILRSRAAGHVASSSVHDESWNSNSHDAFSSIHSCTSSSSSNSGSRNADPKVFARTTVTAPVSTSDAVFRVQSMKGFAPTSVTAVRFTTRIGAF